MSVAGRTLLVEVVDLFKGSKQRTATHIKETKGGKKKGRSAY